MNLMLKSAIAGHPLPAYKIARQLGIYPSRLSGFISGVVRPTTNEKRRLSAVLGRPVAELFPEVAA